MVNAQIKDIKNLRAAEIGARLRKVRKEAGLSLNDIAERLNNEYGATTNKGMISKYENGIHEPSASMVYCLGKVLGVSSDYILGKTDEMLPDQSCQGSESLGYMLHIFTRYNPINGCDEDTSVFELIPKTWLVGGHEYFGIRIVGSSFAPRFYDGDIVIFEKKGKSARNQIALVSVNGEDAFPCLIDKKRNGKWIIPLNYSMKKVFYTTEELARIPVRILGAAVQIRRNEVDL